MLPSLEQAIKAIKAGDKETGRQLLAEVLQADLENETAWLWLSGIVDSDEERRKYLQRVLEINPDNEAAQRGLAIINEKLAEQVTQSEKPLEEAPVTEKSLGTRLAAIEQKKPAPALPEPEPAPAKAVTPPDPTPPKPSPPPEPAPKVVEAALEPMPPERKSVPAVTEAEMPLVEKDDASKIAPEMETDYEVSEIRRQFEQPPSAPLQLALYRLKQYWNTERGMLVIAGLGVGILLICSACIVFSLVFRPIIGEVPATVAAIVGTETPTLTPTPIPPTPTPTFTITPIPTATPTPTPTQTSTPVVLDTPTVTPTPSRTPTADPNQETGQVVDVIEGDMIDVLINGELFRVKYILVDAPELDEPGIGTEPFAMEALNFNRQMVAGQTVTLEKDVSETDSLGRLLRYVYLGDLMVNEALLRQGLARIEMIPPDLKYGARLQEVERDAQAANIGIWSVE